MKVVCNLSSAAKQYFISWYINALNLSVEKLLWKISFLIQGLGVFTEMDELVVLIEGGSDGQGVGEDK